MNAFAVSAKLGRVPVAGGREVDILAFDRVFAEQHDRLLRIALLLTGDRTQAEDAVAEVFARILRRFDQLAIDDMGPYLRRCVVNEVTSTARRHIKGVRLQVLAGGASAADSFDERVDERERLIWALGQLPERQRAAIVLRYYDDLSESDTAAVLEIAVGTVKSSVARGLATLKVLLREEKGHG